MTAGVELECGVRGTAGNLQAVRNAFREVGLSANTGEDLRNLRTEESWRNTAFSAWFLGTDCTSGGEMRSPILHTFEELTRQVTKACEILTAQGYTADNRCGLHVHLGTGTKTNQEVSRFHQFLYRHEDDFMRLVPASRRGNEYCSFLSRNLIRDVSALLSEANARMHWYTRPWFHFSNKGTTEVRLQLGSLDSERIINWICFLQQCWRTSQADRSYDPQWRVLRLVDQIPPTVTSGFPSRVHGTRTAMVMIRSKEKDSVYERARRYAHTYASVA